MNRNIDVQQRVEEHFDFVCQYYPKEQILGVFLYGSQNYDLDCFNSDVDTKAIYIPTFEETVFNKPISKELKLDNGEHCEVKDIREFVNCLYKQNINFVEVLFTQYFVINPKYEKIWNDYFIKAKEEIARYDINKAVHSMSHQASHTLSQAENQLTSGINPCKKVANAARLVYFLQRYLNTEPYEKCLTPVGDAHETLAELKFHPVNATTYISAIKILKMLLNFYKTANFEHLNNTDTQNAIENNCKEGILRLIKL